MFWITLGTLLSWYLLCCDGSCKAPIPSGIPPKISLGNWTINDGANFSAISKDQLGFHKDSAVYLKPLSADLGGAFDSLSSYLIGNSGRNLNVVGYYKGDEKNVDTRFPNLGFARANSIKDYLVSLGVPTSQVSTDGRLLDADWFIGDTLVKGVYFNFTDVVTSIPTPTAETPPTVGKSMTIYFNTNQSRKPLSLVEQSQMDEMIDYLNKVPASRLNVSGHTDNVGSKELNQSLSSARAAFAKNYLSRSGKVSEDRIDVQSYNFEQPATSNDNAGGRARNRRVDITLK